MRELELRPTYVTDRVETMNMREAMRSLPSIELEPQSLTGVKGISIKPVEDFISDQAPYLLHRPQKRFTSSREIGPDLIQILLTGIRDNWEVGRDKLVLMSGGIDSRLIAYCIEHLRNRKGDTWYGNVHYLCTQPEYRFMENTLIDMGVPKDRIILYKKDKADQPDYYTWFDFDFNVNGYSRPWPRHWDQWETGIDHRKCQVITGTAGGEQTNYPASKGPKGLTVYQLLSYLNWPQAPYTQALSDFHSFLNPYLSLDYIRYCTMIHPNVFVLESRNRPESDIIRRAMLTYFHDNNPVHVGHDYNFMASRDTLDYIKYRWENSKLWLDFPEVRDFDPMKDYPYITTATKLYGLATVYEGV